MGPSPVSKRLFPDACIGKTNAEGVVVTCSALRAFELYAKAANLGNVIAMTEMREVLQKKRGRGESRKFSDALLADC